MGSAFHQLCPRYSGTLTPTAPTAVRLWETSTFLSFLGYNANSADPLQMPLFAASEVGLHCLLTVMSMRNTVKLKTATKNP